jgi:hypothetical protein
MIIVGFKVASNEHKILLIKSVTLHQKKIEDPTIKTIRKLLRLTESQCIAYNQENNSRVINRCHKTSITRISTIDFGD